MPSGSPCKTGCRSIYLVDSAGVFLPLQEDVFPDEDDFGRIFRNNAVISAAGIGQIAAIMGNCVAGGGYLPVLCDKLLMTDGSGLYLAGPALVKSAIGQEVSSEDLGGAAMHAQVSGTIDYRDPTDEACLERLRRLAAHVPADPAEPRATVSAHRGGRARAAGQRFVSAWSARPARRIRSARRAGGHSRRRQLRRIQARVRPVGRLRHGAAGRVFRSAWSPISTIACGRPRARWNSAA